MLQKTLPAWLIRAVFFKGGFYNFLLIWKSCLNCCCYSCVSC